jgi:2-polyprenyl-3-methyl-5-hydroxy-6-metoxy-1,4-benzoquinol methylase
MSDLGQQYDLRLAAAYVRGHLDRERSARIPLDQMTVEELERAVRLGIEAGLRLHPFKLTAGLPRVTRVLGVLKGIAPTSLIDVGSGRGVFLWPLLSMLPALPVVAIDTRRDHLETIDAVRRGGFERLRAQRMDAKALAFDDNAFDVITALEVLEHIADVQQAVAEVVRVARRFVVVSVPSKPDDNPKHLRLLDRAALEGLFSRVGVERLTFDNVLGHLIAVARVGS